MSEHMEAHSDERGDRRSFHKKRSCRFCAAPEMILDYKDKYTLSQFLTERYKIVPSRISGLCARHQRDMTREVKRARHIGILAYSTAQHD